MGKILPFFLLLLMLSCASRRGRHSESSLKVPDFYSVVISETNCYNDTAKGNVILKHKSFNPIKTIFGKLSGELANSKHLIYLFSWENNLPSVTNDFKAIVVDKTTGRGFYAFNLDDGNEIGLKTELPDEFSIEDFVLKSYSQKRIDFLKSLQNRFSSAEMGQDYIIYEVDLINKVNKLTVLNSVTFGKNELTRLDGG